MLTKKINQYYNRKDLTFERLPLKVLKLHRTKWKFVQNKIRKHFKLLKNFSILKAKEGKIPFKKSSIPTTEYLNFIKVNCRPSTWSKVKKEFKTSFNSNMSLQVKFFKVFSKKFFKREKKIKNTVNLINKKFVRPEFNLSILLLRLRFFKSIYETKNAINFGNVKVNQKKIYNNVFLDKGDIITLDESIIKYYPQNSIYISNRSLNPYIETDYYSGTIVVLKSYTEFDYKDYYLFLKQRFNINKLLK